MHLLQKSNEEAEAFKAAILQSLKEKDETYSKLKAREEKYNKRSLAYRYDQQRIHPRPGTKGRAGEVLE